MWGERLCAPPWLTPNPLGKAERDREAERSDPARFSAGRFRMAHFQWAIADLPPPLPLWAT
jgi:hypothetical protein